MNVNGAKFVYKRLNMAIRIRNPGERDERIVSSPASERPDAFPTSGAEEAVPAIGGAQIRAARGLLDWTASELAKRSGVARMTIQRFEKHQGVPPCSPDTRAAVKRALEKGHIEFMGDPVSHPGVMVKKRRPRPKKQKRRKSRR
jgi:DNA-binding XRE family transcriptional regulator